MPTPKAIATTIALLSANYGADKLPSSADTLAMLWQAALGDMPDADLEAAAFAHIANPDAGRFWPTIADLFAANPNRPPSIEARWDEMRRRIARGDAPSDFLSAPELRALGTIGGTWALRRMDTNEEAAVKRRWCAAVRDGAAAAKQLQSGHLRAIEGGRK